MDPRTRSSRPRRGCGAASTIFAAPSSAATKTAYRLALADFHERLVPLDRRARSACSCPALRRTSFPGRDPQRELRLEYVQIRELTRYLLSQIDERAPLADVLGLVENLERRLAAHESEMEKRLLPRRRPAPDARRAAAPRGGGAAAVAGCRRPLSPAGGSRTRPRRSAAEAPRRRWRGVPRSSRERRPRRDTRLSPAGLHQHDRALALVARGGEAPRRERRAAFPRPDRHAVERQRARVRQPGNGFRG